MGIILTKLDDVSGPFSFFLTVFLSDAMFHCAHVLPWRYFTGTHMYRRVFIALAVFCMENAFQSTKDAQYEVSDDAFPHGHRPWNQRFFT